MDTERADLVHRVLDLQASLYRHLRPAREWLEVDLTMPQLKVLLVLCSQGPASMSQLAGQLGVTLSTATGIVDRLVERNLISRQESPHDRRLVLCTLTASGQVLAERMYQSGRSRMAQLVTVLDDSELRTVAAALELLLIASQRQGGGAITPMEASEQLVGIGVP